MTLLENLDGDLTGDSSVLKSPAEYQINPVNGRDTMSTMLTERIEINPAIMLGKPVIRGTRIPVELIIRKLGEGASEADLLDAYPRLTKEDISAALTYAADSLAHETILLQAA
jgi:uncharacterized protein (DUF433 family)